MRKHTNRIATLVISVLAVGSGAFAEEDQLIREAQERAGLLGDLDGNGLVDRADLDAMIGYLSGSEIKGVPLDLYDLNGDGRVDVADLSILGGIVSEKELEEPEILRGDVTNDGIIDERDLILLMDIVGGADAKPLGPREAADYNQDGKIDLADLLELVDDYYNNKIVLP